MHRKLLTTWRAEESASGIGQFGGYASVYGVMDSYGDVVVKGAFDRALAYAEKTHRYPPVLLNHDPDKIAGKWVAMKVDDVGLYVEGVLDDELEEGRKARRWVKEGLATGLSIGFTSRDADLGLLEDGRFEIKGLDLKEISITPIPALDVARVDFAKMQDMSERDLERLLSGVVSRKAAQELVAARKTMLAQRDARQTADAAPRDASALGLWAAAKYAALKFDMG